MNQLTFKSLYACSSVAMFFMATLVGCGGTGAKSGAGNDQGPSRVTLMLNWYPEAEHGGFYAAKVHGIYEKYGLDVEIRSGGPNAPVAQEMVTGRVQFGIGNADDVLLLRQQDVKVVSLLAPIQNTPRCVVVREDSGVTSLDGLKGMTLQAAEGRPFLDYMRSKKMLEDVRIVPYQGSVVALVNDKMTATQAYSFSEPFVAEQQGVKVRSLMLSDIGYNPYASCLMCTEDYLEKNADLVKRMTLASQEGWQKYFEDATETNAAILAENKEGMTMEALAYGVEQLRGLSLPDGLPASEIGKMSLERWEQLIAQFVELGLVDATKVKASDVFKTK